MTEINSFARLSMGVHFGIRAPRSEVIQQVMPGTRYFFTFQAANSPQSEQLADALVTPRRMVVQMGMASPREGTPFEEYWNTPWRRSRAPSNLPQGTKILWSRRVGM